MKQKITSFADVNQAVAHLSEATKRHHYSIEHMLELLEFLGNPQKRLKVVHVAGTSGKTSTAYYAAALLGAAGKTVGLTVSPHVDEVNERVQIGLRPLPEAEFCARFGEFLDIIKECRVTPNYFELFIAFAFWEFAARRVDYAVVEVGIGGLLDSTNVFDDPHKVCVITDIGYDHTSLLGNTLPEIAAQKAGIINLRNAVFCNRQGDDVMEVIQKEAARKHADLHMLTSPGLDAEFDFLPLFQRRNFGLALAAAQFVAGRDGLKPLDDPAIQKAAHTVVPARMETINYKGKILIMDGAHNAQKIAALVAGIRDRYAGLSVAALVGMADGRSYRADSAAGEMAKLAGHIIVTQFEESSSGHDGSMKGNDLLELLRRNGAKSAEMSPAPEAAFGLLMERPEPVLVVTGSFYLLNHIRPLLGQSLHLQKFE